MAKDAEGYVPIYLPDDTVIGKAKIEGDIIQLEVKDSATLMSFIQDNLIGLSVVYMGAVPEPISNTDDE